MIPRISVTEVFGITTIYRSNTQMYVVSVELALLPSAVGSGDTRAGTAARSGPQVQRVSKEKTSVVDFFSNLKKVRDYLRSFFVEPWEICNVLSVEFFFHASDSHRGFRMLCCDGRLRVTGRCSRAVPNGGLQQIFLARTTYSLLM